MKKSTIKKFVPGVMVGLLTVTGAFAWLNTTKVANGVNTIQPGSFDLEIHSEENALGAAGVNETGYLLAQPLSDTEGKALTPYGFTVKNTGTIPVMARLYCSAEKSVVADIIVPKDKVNLYIVDEGNNVIYEGKVADFESAAGQVFKLTANAEKVFRMYAWIDGEATNADLYGAAGDKTSDIKIKIHVVGLQALESLGFAETETLGTEWEAAWNDAASESGL